MGAQRQPPFGDVAARGDSPPGELLDLADPVAEGLLVDVQFGRGVPPGAVDPQDDPQGVDVVGALFGVPGVLVFFGTTKVFALLVSFASFGFILSYYLPILGLAYRRIRGRDLGAAWGERWIGAVTAVAVVWLTAEIVNLGGPGRSPPTGT
ncbi:MAG TPA: hypothetical protein VFB06_22475 [Streptosporangiaceae bacterium]|nr:hypothetical protein [Streptosporangiaceae bacterium]